MILKSENISPKNENNSNKYLLPGDILLDSIIPLGWDLYSISNTPVSYKASLLTKKNNSISPSSSGRITTLGKQYFSSSEKELFIKRKIGPLSLKLKLKNISEKNTTLEVNSSYIFFSRFLISFYRLPCYLGVLMPLFHIKLLQAHLSWAHAGAISYNGEGILLVAPSEVGKSTNIFSLISNSNFHYLSDDFIIFDEKRSGYAFPGYLRKHNIETMKKMGILSDRVPAKEYPVTQFFREKIIPKVPIKHIILMRRGLPEVVERSAESALDDIQTSTFDGEFHYLFNPFVRAYSLTDDSLHLQELYDIEMDLLKNVIANSNIQQITFRDPNDFCRLLKSVL